MEEKQILLIGFGPAEETVRELMKPMEINVRAFGASALHQTVGALCSLPSVSEEALPAALIMFENFTREDLDPVLKLLREAALPKQPLKAMVTPTNRSWKIRKLMAELQEEQQIMGEIIKLKRLRDSLPMPAFDDIPAMKARMMAEVQLRGGEGVTAETVKKAYDALLKYKK